MTKFVTFPATATYQSPANGELLTDNYTMHVDASIVTGFRDNPENRTQTVVYFSNNLSFVTTDGVKEVADKLGVVYDDR